MRRVIPILLALALSACVNHLAERQARLNQLVGLREPDLVRVMGVPTRAFESEGTKFLAYLEQRIDLIPGSYGFQGSPYWGPGGYWGPAGIPSQAMTLTCETTFTLTAGVVRSYTLRGNACG